MIESVPSTIPIAPTAASERMRSPRRLPSRRTGASSIAPTMPAPMKLSRKSVPIVGTTRK
jgi:hypothetical protein